MEGISSALGLVLSVAARNLNRRGEGTGVDGQVLAAMAAVRVLRKTNCEALIAELYGLGVPDQPVVSGEVFQDGELTPLRRAALAVLQFLEREDVAQAFGLTCRISPGLLQGQGV
jgi:hypothetical protein